MMLLSIGRTTVKKGLRALYFIQILYNLRRALHTKATIFTSKFTSKWHRKSFPFTIHLLGWSTDEFSCLKFTSLISEEVYLNVPHVIWYTTISPDWDPQPFHPIFRLGTKINAQFKRGTFQVPNQMQINLSKGFCSLTLDSTHEKFDV